ncbi:MAG: hypothetical protein C4308_12550 [Chitinophagaceae bacterium]
MPGFYTVHLFPDSYSNVAILCFIKKTSISELFTSEELLRRTVMAVAIGFIFAAWSETNTAR